jgi:hypothetical protein
MSPQDPIAHPKIPDSGMDQFLWLPSGRVGASSEPQIHRRRRPEARGCPPARRAIAYCHQGDDRLLTNEVDLASSGIRRYVLDQARRFHYVSS